MTDNLPVRNPDTVRGELLHINTVDGVVWREIALLPQYSGIPAGTLCSIAKGAPIPKKHKKKLGVSEPIPTEPCPICGEVHTKGHPKPRKPHTPRNAPGKVWLY